MKVECGRSRGWCKFPLSLSTRTFHSPPMSKLDPLVLFFDEVNALAADRNDFKRSAGRTLRALRRPAE